MLYISGGNKVDYMGYLDQPGTLLLRSVIIQWVSWRSYCTIGLGIEHATTVCCQIYRVIKSVLSDYINTIISITWKHSRTKEVIGSLGQPYHSPGANTFIFFLLSSLISFCMFLFISLILACIPGVNATLIRHKVISTTL